MRRRAKKKYYKNYEKLNTRYKFKNCFIINKKLYYKWEEKISKKFYQYYLSTLNWPINCGFNLLYNRYRK